MARGVVRDYEPLAADPGWPGNFWSFVPAGHMPFGHQCRRWCRSARLVIP